VEFFGSSSILICKVVCEIWFQSEDKLSLTEPIIAIECTSASAVEFGNRWHSEKLALKGLSVYLWAHSANTGGMMLQQRKIQS
jgi:hypothetical protein